MTTIYKEVKSVYVWTTKVRPVWWQPWANTITYYNINSNDTNSTIYDLVWNLDMTWYWTVAYQNDANYGRVAYFNWSNAYCEAWWKCNLWTDFTMITLFNIDPWKTSPWTVISQLASSSAYPIGMWYKYIDYTSYYNWWLYKHPPINSTSIVSNNWVMMAVTRANNWTTKLYINWVLEKTETISSTINYNSWANLQIARRRSWDNEFHQWCFKLFIWENRVWTDAEVAALATEYGF